MKQVKAEVLPYEGGCDINLNGDDCGLDYSIFGTGKDFLAAKDNFLECYRDAKTSSEDNHLPFEEVDFAFFCGDVQMVSVFIEKNDEGYVSCCSEQSVCKCGINGFGDSEEEAKADLQVAYEECKEMKAEEGVEMPKVEFFFYYYN